MTELVGQIEALIEASISSSPSPARASTGPSSYHNIVAKQNAIIYLVLLFIRVISSYSTSFYYNTLSIYIISLSLSLSFFLSLSIHAFLYSPLQLFDPSLKLLLLQITVWTFHTDSCLWRIDYRNDLTEGFQIPCGNMHHIGRTTRSWRIEIR